MLEELQALKLDPVSNPVRPWAGSLSSLSLHLLLQQMGQGLLVQVVGDKFKSLARHTVLSRGAWAVSLKPWRGGRGGRRAVLGTGRDSGAGLAIGECLFPDRKLQGF